MNINTNTNKAQVTGGAFLSYILIILNAVYGFLLMPYIISSIGASEYGVYRTIYSFAIAFMILDLGLGGTLMRYISKFKGSNESEKIPSFIGMTVIQGVIMAIVVVVISVFVYFSIDDIFKNGLTNLEVILAKRLFIFLMISVVMHIFENILNGIITGFNLFVVGNGIKLARLFFRIIFTYIVLIFVKSAFALIAIDLILIIGMVVFEVIYIRYKLKITIAFSSIDWKLMIESFKYTMLLFTTSIVAQVNNNLDNVVIGALINTSAVTIYSLALQFFNVFTQLSTSISNVMLPTVTESLINDDKSLSNTKEIVINTGRIQFIILGAAFMGFLIIGKNFIRLWIDNELNYHIYYLSLILMLPALFELITNINITILRAKNMLGFRTIVLIISTILNLLVTIIGTYYWNFYAAAIGTAISFIFGSIITMNIYYKVKLGFNMVNIYSKIFKRTWVCLMSSAVITSLIIKALHSDIYIVVVGSFSFLFIYFVSMITYGFSESEKIYFNKFTGKISVLYRKVIEIK